MPAPFLPSTIYGDTMYCTLDDIKKQIPEETILQLTDDAGLGEIDQVIVDEAITNACAIIDGYCSSRYLIPFAVVPAIIKPVAVDLAVYNLYARRVETMPEVRAANQKNAIKLLVDISQGRIQFGAQAATSAVQPQQSPSITSSPRLFSRDKMRGL
jgi:phage gp36-like protein